VCTHTKIGEIVPGFPPKDDKMCFCFFFLLPMQHGLSATYPTPILTIFEKKMSICVRIYTPVKNFRISLQVVFQVPKQPKGGACDKSTAQIAQFQAMGIISGVGWHERVLVGDVRFGHYEPQNNPNFSDQFYRLTELPACHSWFNVARKVAACRLRACTAVLEQHNFRWWESFQGLVDIPRTCFLYVSFGGGHTVWAVWASEKPHFRWSVPSTNRALCLSFTVQHHLQGSSLPSSSLYFSKFPVDPLHPT